MCLKTLSAIQKWKGKNATSGLFEIKNTEIVPDLNIRRLKDIFAKELWSAMDLLY